MAFRLLLNVYKLRNSKVVYPSDIYNHNHIYTGRIVNKKSIYKTNEVKKIRSYFLHKYVSYLKNYNEVLEKKFPGAMRVYRVFMDGTRSFFGDIRLYINIVRNLNNTGKKLHNLTLGELELYYQMPRDMRKVAPVLLISALPLANYVIFPLAYYFPRQLLCRHFWNLQQKAEFNIIFLKKRLIHNKPIFRYLQLQLPRLKKNELHKRWSHILGLLGSGVHPTTEEILECKDLFMNGPYHLTYLSGNHVKHLLKMHEMHSGWFRRTRLGDKAIILKAMDRAILKEGGPQRLPHDILKTACLIRGLNPTNMRTEDMVKWIVKWITISNAIDKEAISLLLHCPVLLGYNEPTNWQLIYSHKNKQSLQM